MRDMMEVVIIVALVIMLTLLMGASPGWMLVALAIVADVALIQFLSRGDDPKRGLMIPSAA